MIFLHHGVIGNPQLIESICRFCGLAVGASQSISVLKIAETVHHCEESEHALGEELHRG